MKLNWNCSMKNTQHISYIHISMRNLLVSTCLPNHSTVAYNDMLIESQMLQSILKGPNVQRYPLPMWYYISTLPVFFTLSPFGTFWFAVYFHVLAWIAKNNFFYLKGLHNEIMLIYSEETVVFTEIILCLLMNIIPEFNKLTTFSLNTNTLCPVCKEWIITYEFWGTGLAVK